MSEIPLDAAPREVSDAAHDATRGQVVYLTEHGERFAATVPAELAAELENLGPEALQELLEDFADARAARETLAEIEASRQVPSRLLPRRYGRNSASRRKRRSRDPRLRRDLPAVLPGVHAKGTAGAAETRPACDHPHQGSG